MKKLMVLGAGFPQVQLMEAAASLGYQTLVCSIPGSYPGFEYADEITYTDISDPEAVLNAAIQCKADGVATCCLDTGIRALGHVCQALGLPGIHTAAAEISDNKLAMKQAFQKGNVLSARYALLKTTADVDLAVEQLGLPLVVKAVDLQGSTGVSIAETAEQAREAFSQSLAVTHVDYCLAEEFISGDNIGAEAFVQNGKVLFVLPDGTLSHHGRTNIPIGHYVPLNRPEPVLAAIREEVEKAIRVCNFDDCAVNVDLVLHGDKPYIIELSARAGATCLAELVSLYYGVDYFRMIAMAAMGEDVSPVFNKRRAAPLCCAASMISAPAEGVVSAVRLPQELSDDVRDLHLIVKPGDRVRPFNNSRDRIGQIIVSGDSTAACLARIDDTLAQLRIEVE